MKGIQKVLSILLFIPAVFGMRMKDKQSKRMFEQQIGTVQRFAEKYPLCAKKLDDLGMELRDLLLTKEEVAKLFTPPSNCSWWESSACKQAYALDLSNNYFLRMTLVGQPDPRGPTLYTPQAQAAVIEQMRKSVSYMLHLGRRVPDIAFMEDVFKGIDVEDTGSLMVDIMNSFAAVFNRGSKDTLYRSKDVTTRPYDLSTWGDDMLNKIEKNNNLTYTDYNGQVSKALGIKDWGYGSGRHSFIYKLPPRGIQKELQNILDGFVEKSDLLTEISSLAAFELAEKWIRDIVILHPFTDSNGRTARVSLNILLLLNGLAPIVMAKQDEDMTSTPDELRDRICEGMAYAKSLLHHLPNRQVEIASGATSSQAPRCCSAKNRLARDTDWCVSVPANLECAAYSELTQSSKYLEWNDGKTCSLAPQDPGLCPRGVDKKRLKKDLHFFLDDILHLPECSTIPTFPGGCSSESPGACYTPGGSNPWQCWNYEQASATMSDKSCKQVPGMAGACRSQNSEPIVYKCETVPTYDQKSSASCPSSTHKEGIACFSLRKGVTWQCFDQLPGGNRGSSRMSLASFSSSLPGFRRFGGKGTKPGCSTTLIPDSEQLESTRETYYGACVHEKNKRLYESADNATPLALLEASIATTYDLNNTGLLDLTMETNHMESENAIQKGTDTTSSGMEDELVSAERNLLEKETHEQADATSSKSLVDDQGKP